MDKVSVVITTYKRSAKLLKNAIDAAVKQTYLDTEIVVVDDNNNRELSNEIQACLSEYAGRVEYLGYEGNHGACYARNFGADATKGKYIAFLDDDDIWYPNKLEKQVECLKSGCYSMVGCNSYHVVVDSEWKELKRVLDIRTRNNEISMEELLNKNVVGGCSFPLITREAFYNAGKFTVGMPASQDYDLWIRIRKIGKICHVQEPLLDYYIHQEACITHDPTKKIESYHYLIQKYSSLAENENAFRANKYYDLSDVCFISMDFKNGWKYLKKGYAEKPGLSSFKRVVLGIKTCCKGHVKKILKHKYQT